ncbi:class I SAM-dependent methyltransferase [Fulvivirgaceae bacterium BMA12]|uniref:Class I SAM-dependent methyltransferase n=1 Tax=Agaribacillus aureus TaxID=3051825 RepID=A0ABT8LCM4_9BACT|nr:class I SAM-dependent methyltransferase [Fulvivirgaceae bacterium BMA12]
MNSKPCLSEDQLNYLTDWFTQNWSLSSKINNVYSLGLLQNLLVDFPFVPYTKFGLNPTGLLFIINDILINNRKYIIEFGAGVSTIVIARLIKKNSLNTRLISVEHDEGWLEMIANTLQKEKLSQNVKPIYAPLSECDLSINGMKWYNTKTLDNYIADQKFDAIIVDGPPSYSKEIMFSRYPAIPYLKDKLNTNIAIYLDDVEREGEREILKKWSEILKINFEIYDYTFGIYLSEKSYWPHAF